MYIIHLTKRDLETIGTRSLEGLLLKNNMAKPAPITIRFQQSSTGWRQSNGGPEPLIIPEYVPMCLCESIVNLQAQGFTVTIEPFIQDSVTE